MDFLSNWNSISINVKSNSKLSQVSLYLLGYWYKHQEKDTVTQTFKDNHDYWMTALEILGSKRNAS
jgi:hypothetical protein